MDTIGSFLGQDHQDCDEQYLLAEAHAGSGNWAAAELDFAAFAKVLEQHMQMEEQIMFPALEAAIGSNYGPTSVMRSEHQQLRQIVGRMSDSIAQRSTDAFFDDADTLRMLLRQHNLKEESILYPMAERVLGEEQACILAAMEALAFGEHQTEEAGQADGGWSEQPLDVTGLEAPEPMVRVLDALSRLGQQQKLRVLIDREPHPLYRILENYGYEHRTEPREDFLFDVLIWEQADKTGAQAAPRPPVF
ncbi:hemerythrin domain-containing protein [Massilia sp. BJB1822]|uniref:hemerythrin domain-containing protein n=1 Tax=Massilia sp. BJB1822 TaxID=2744470 RepID=UPI001E39692F|nr:hemerythrin domain-containing protein [Massilia sp. BJB1822]